jgi:nuclear pore complex protein Nup62
MFAGGAAADSKPGFGAAVPAPAAGTGFSFGTAAPGGGFSFGTSSGTTAPASGFAFGSTGTTAGFAVTDDRTKRPNEDANVSSTSGSAAGGFTFAGNAPAAGDAKAQPFQSPTPATGGSLFGGANMFASAAAGTNNSGAPAPSVTPSISFGGAPPVAGDTKPSAPAATGGFSSFGGSSTPAGDNKPSAPAATSGFTFGGTSTSAEDTKPLAAATGGFTFGGTAPLAGDTKPFAAATGDSSFGGSTLPAGDTKPPATPTQGFFGGTSTPAGDIKPPATPAQSFPAFGGSAPFGGQSNQASQAPDPPTPGPPLPVATPAKASAPTPAASKEPAQLDYQTFTVEQILNKFQQNLEADALAYVEEAKRVAEYEAILRDSQRDIASLTTQSQRCLYQQQQVESALVGIGATQEQLDHDLYELEQHVDELFTARPHLAPVDADVEREQAYTTAMAVEQRLQAVSARLQETAHDMDAAQERALGNSNVGAVVRILNQHLQKLAELEIATARMDHDIKQAARVFQN